MSNLISEPNMIRNIVLAAAAVTALAAPASAQSIHISTVGKTSAQVDAEVQKAARELCFTASWNSTFPAEERWACIRHTVSKAYALAGLSAPTRLATR